MATFKRLSPHGASVTHDDVATTKRMLPDGEQIIVEGAAAVNVFSRIVGIRAALVGPGGLAG